MGDWEPWDPKLTFGTNLLTSHKKSQILCPHTLSLFCNIPSTRLGSPYAGCAGPGGRRGGQGGLPLLIRAAPEIYSVYLEGVEENYN